MEAIYDFLSFKTFISPSVLFIFYYLGALVVPFFMMKYLHKFYTFIGIKIDDIVTKEQKIKIFIFASLMFLFLEVLWRMMFEFLIAYLQIREALVV